MQTCHRSSVSSQPHQHPRPRPSPFTLHPRPRPHPNTGVLLPELLPTVSALVVLRRRPIVCCRGGSQRSAGVTYLGDPTPPEDGCSECAWCAECGRWQWVALLSSRAHAWCRRAALGGSNGCCCGGCCLRPRIDNVDVTPLRDSESDFL